jgi:hypothetical protein
LNIFIELHESRFGGPDTRFGSGWENLFTEQLAFFLTADLPAATALAQALSRDDSIRAKGVATQLKFDGGIPDLRLECEGCTSIYLENKFEAPLGQGQLESYLTLGRVALVSRRSQSVPAKVLSNPSYLRPTDRHYFHWSDVYTALAQAEAPPAGFGALRAHFKGYMRELGLAPSALTTEWRRLFEERTAPGNRDVQRDFGFLLEPVSANLRGLGLEVKAVSHKGKMALSPPGSEWSHLYVKPERVRADLLEATDCALFEPGYEGLVVELVFEASRVTTMRTIHEALRGASQDLRSRGWCVVRPRAIGRDRRRLSLATPLVPYLQQRERMSQALSESALWALDRLLSAAASATGTNGNC